MEHKGIHKLQDIAHLSKADIHIHTCYSDGRPDVEAVLDYVQNKTDLDIIAIADHDTMEGAFLAQEMMKTKNYRFELVLAEEITSKEGHILGLFLKEPIPPGLEVHTVIKRIKEQGGVAIAAHPFMHTRWRNPKIIMMDGIGFVALMREKDHLDGVEIVNATPTLGEENLQAAFVNRTLMFKAETGASDAHILEAIGKGYTLFEGKTAADLRHALIHHQTQAMYAKWTFFALLRYLFFFIPKGVRMVWYTLTHGRLDKRPELVNIPKPGKSDGISIETPKE
ncbi:MAG: phosphotransferase [Candidatus Berkelbacteria bacterium]|nr:phosphotransferase [Candidatus Berkelbacteria bacterium]